MNNNIIDKKQLDKLIAETTIPPEVELKKSPLGGFGIFAKNNIKSGYQFICKKLYTRIFQQDLHNYTWFGGNIFGGLGYYCNGSCDYFEKVGYGKTINGIYTVQYNMSYKPIQNDILTLYATRDICQGEELILNYGNSYFIRIICKI